jgi:hypothetical protein
MEDLVTHGVPRRLDNCWESVCAVSIVDRMQVTITNNRGLSNMSRQRSHSRSVCFLRIGEWRHENCSHFDICYAELVTGKVSQDHLETTPCPKALF